MLLNSQRYLVMGMFVDIPRLQEGHCVLGWCICAVRVWPESPNKPHITTPGRPFSDQVWSCCSNMFDMFYLSVSLSLFSLWINMWHVFSIHYRTQFNITYLRHPNTSWQNTNGFQKHTWNNTFHLRRYGRMSREYLRDPGLEFTGLLGPSPTWVWFLYCHHHKMRSIRWRHLRQSLSLLKNFQVKLYKLMLSCVLDPVVFFLKYFNFKWKKHGKQQLLEFLESESILIFLHGWEASFSHHVLHTAKHLKIAACELLNAGVCTCLSHRKPSKCPPNATLFEASPARMKD